MSKINDLTGQRFNRLTVMKQYGRTEDQHVLWLCKCECGGTITATGKSLKSGHTQSCGCLHKQNLRTMRYKHGDWNKRLYVVWQSMKKRCESPTCKSFIYYGAKGVSVCEEWHEYLAFKEWALASGYDETAPKGECTLDRIDPFGNYEPSNCRWVSMAVQCKNKRADKEAAR